MNNTYIINDVNGNPMNAKYPPNKEFYGEKFSGYKSQNEKILFHDFVVMSKDVSFMHNGTRYYFYVHNTTAIAYNVELKEKIAEYPNELDLLENFTIDGQPFISLIDEIDDIKTFYNVFKPHLALDDNGYPYNCKYPPNKEKYGDIYEGYKTWTEEVLFHRFGILCYDVCFVYKNNEYHLLKEYNYAAVCDEHCTEEYETFADEMALIENFKINGKPLIELIDDITEIDSV